MKRLISSFIVCIALFLGAMPLVATAQNEGRYNIIPRPESLTPVAGEFQLTPQTTIYAKRAEKVGKFFADKLSRATGYSIALTGSKKKASIVLEIDKKVAGEEAYRLSVTPGGVKATASTEKGLFYAMESLMQLFPPQVESKFTARGVNWTAPACEISDKPRFAYRGTLIDVCRHFFPLEQLKKNIDLMAMYKINNLHLHLTEDQGWRVEIKKYPKLTEVGAWRETEHGRVGGYYTQAELRDLVSYAADRFVNIVPEFEMPGHELAAIAAYPWLSCENSKVEPRRIWGVEPIVMCPGKESTFKFLEDVVDELVAIFPSKLFHIGGDEAPRDKWKTCPLCQKMIQELGLKDEPNRSKEAQLQSYVVGRMEKYINKYGKSIIGWDEILEGGNLNKSAIVMSWRGEQGGITAANAGHKVIMTPSSGGLYLDHYQGEPSLEPAGIGGYAPLEKIYAYNPVPKAVSDKGMQEYVLGPQANLWTEYIANNEMLDYRLFPRQLALAEIGWTPLEKKNYQDFCRRVDNDAAIRMNEHGVNFHIPLPEQEGGSTDLVAFTDKAEVAFKTTRPERMVYTLDGSMPNKNSATYEKPFSLTATTTIKIATILPTGFMSPVRTVRVEKQELSSPSQVSEPLVGGLNLQWAKGTYLKTEELANVTEWNKKVIKNLKEVRSQKAGGDYSSIATGYVKIEKSGVYYFRSNNAEVWIDGSKVVDNNNLAVKRAFHNTRTMALAAGLHKIKVVFLGHIAAGVPTTWDDGNVQFRFGATGNYQNITPEMLFQ